MIALRGLLAAGLLAFAGLAGAAETIGRDAWSFDRSELAWYRWAKVEEFRAKGIIKDAAGWTEYDFSVPAAGWFELWERDSVPGWPRDIFLDGALLFQQTESRPEDTVKAQGRGWFKEANLHLAAGSHTLRFRRLSFPGVLPGRWELRPSDGDPAGCIRATGIGHSVVRAGTRIRIQITGGTTAPTRYPLVLRDEASSELTECGVVEFPATPAPVEQAVDVIFPRQGVFQLLARIGDRLSRPADLKAGSFIVIDTRQPTAPSATLATTPAVRIDCVAQTIDGRPVQPGATFFEKDGATRVVAAPFGSYRESSGKGVSDHWATDGFSYKVDLPDTDHLYRLRVTYPDDDRRSMGFWTNDGSDGRNGVTLTGGVETGDRYPLTRAMQVHEAYFYPLKHQGVVVAAINLVPGHRAAAASIAIDRVEGPLPAGPAGGRGGRSMGFFFEEGPRWMRFFGAKAGEGIAGQLEHLRSLDRWGQWNRHLGADLMFPTVNIYQYNMYPSRLLDGYFCESHDATRMVALTAEKYGGRFVGEFHLSGQSWFDQHVMGVRSEESEQDGKKTSRLLIEPRAEAWVLRDRDGRTDLGNNREWGYNALHPEVQERYIAIIGEFADRLADCPSFAGVSSRLMLSWMWQGWNALPGLHWGYDDWTVAQFAKDTGLAVPGAAGDPRRFRQRYDWLTGPQRERWIDWRCGRIFAYHCRIRDRIRQAKPDAKLFFNWFGQDPRQTASTDALGQMREIGMDPRRYADVDGIVVIPNAFYGRRYSTPVGDAVKAEPLFADDVKTVARFGDRGFALYTDYYEVNDHLDWEKLGGRKGSCAFDCCAPSGVNERELYALALADSDTSVLLNGGNGWMFGTPSVLSPFLREYRALPAVRFEPFAKARDPVAVWTRRIDAAQAATLGTSAGLHLYAVNRLPEAIEVRLAIDGPGRVVALADGVEVPREGRSVAFTLAPFMLRALRLDGRADLVGCTTGTPLQTAARLNRTLPTTTGLLDALRLRQIAPELGRTEADAAIAALDGSRTAAAEGRWWQALGWLGRPDLVRLYDIAGRYPAGLFERQVPHGLVPADDPPAVEPAGLMGDVRGRLAAITDLDLDPDGSLWAASADQVMVVDGTGSYRRSPVLALAHKPFEGDARWGGFDNPRYLDTASLRIAPDRRIAALAWHSAPAFYDPADGRLLRLRDGAAGLAVPGMRCSLLAIDRRGDTYVSCPEPAAAAGVYKFRADGTPAFEPAAADGQRFLTSAASGGAVDAAGNLHAAVPDGLVVVAPDGRPLASATTAACKGLGRLVVSSDGSLLFACGGDGQVHGFRPDAAAGFARIWSWKPPARVTALALASDGGLVVGFARESDGAVARRYALAATGPQAGKDLVQGLSAIATRSLRGPTQLKMFDGKLHFLAHGKLMRLAPGAIEAAEVAHDPGQVANGIESFTFAPDGTLYLAANFGFFANSRGMNVYRCARRTDGGWDKPVMINDGKPLVANWSFSPTDLEVDAQGRLILRLDDPEAKPGGPSVSLFRWSADGTRERIIDLGPTAHWGDYGLHLAADGSLLVAGGGTRTITRLAPDGQIAWQVRAEVHQGHGTLPLRQPLGITSDRRGRVWVTEPARNQVLCFAPDGRFLAAYGRYGDLDARDGLAFRMPMGIAAVTDAGGAEWLYIADVGNQRLVRWRLR